MEKGSKQLFQLFIVSAPSGAGKTTLVNRVVERLRDRYGLSRLSTHTSRNPRAGEIPGTDYIYVSPEEFERKQAEGFFLEVSGALGNSYGTGRDILEALAKGPGILILDQDGARKLKDQLDAVLIWIAVPAIEILEQRLRIRGTENEAQIARRVQRAQQEIELEGTEKLYDFCIENDDLERAIEKLAWVVESVLAQRDTKTLKNLLTDQGMQV